MLKQRGRTADAYNVALFADSSVAGPHHQTSHHAHTHAWFTGKHNNARCRRRRRVNELHVVMHTILASARTHSLTTDRTSDCGYLRAVGRGGGGSHLAAEAIIWELPPQWPSSVACPLSLENGQVDFAATGYRFSGNAGRNFQDSLSCRRHFLPYERERLLLSRSARWIRLCW